MPSRTLKAPQKPSRTAPNNVQPTSWSWGLSLRAAMIRELLLTKSVGGSKIAVHHEPVGDEHQRGDDGERPPRVGLHEQELAERAGARGAEADPAAALRAGDDGDGGDQLEHAERQDDPAPGAEVD